MIISLLLKAKIKLIKWKLYERMNSFSFDSHSSPEQQEDSLIAN